MDILSPTDPDVVLFRHSELADPVSNEVRFHPGFVGSLVTLRTAFAHPMRVTGPARTRTRNAAMPGAHPRSLHIYDAPAHGLKGCCALDVHVGDAAITGWFVRLALKMGWSCGVARSFVHIDRRDFAGLVAGSVFGYGNR